MGQHVIENYRQKGSDKKAYEEGWERIFGKKKGPEHFCLFCEVPIDETINTELGFFCEPCHKKAETNP